MKNITKRELVRFLENLSGEKEGDDFQVMSGKQGSEFSEYSHAHSIFYISFDGSNLYEAFNHYDEKEIYGSCYTRDNKFQEFCKEHNIMGELGNAWNMNIYNI